MIKNNIHRSLFPTVFVAAASALAFSAQAAESLAAYYLYLQPNWYTPTTPGYDPNAPRTATPPLLQVDSQAVIDIRNLMKLQYTKDTPRRLGVFDYWRSANATPCRFSGTYLAIPSNVEANSTVVDSAFWYYPSSSLCAESSGGIGPPFETLSARDEVTFAAPKRRTALDGSQYDASAMVMVRNGVPWATYQWGYRLGLVASTSDWNPANAGAAPELLNWPAVPSKRDEFELTKLPPPWIEDDVVEYVNRADFPAQPGGQYFYAVRAEDKTLLDSIPAWQRSGKSFKSGGYVSACRFYGGKNGGPNTHFYSADDKECAALKAIPLLAYEGQTFAVNVPLPGAAVGGVKPCPIDSKPLYRVYNNASASNGRFVSNHRYLTERADVAAVVAQGWVDEGQVMCVPL